MVNTVLSLYIKLMRLDKPIGIWLLFWPCCWSLGLACYLKQDFSYFFMYILFFFIGAILMRGAGCIINDIIDKDLDKHISRTMSRPLAAQTISQKNAYIFLFILLFLSFLVLIQFNFITILIGSSSLILVVIYPYMKRFIWWPQAFLGLTFNWGALLGWSAITESVSWSALLLYMGGVFWTLGYDTIYGYQDIEDDKAIGIKSTSRLFGQESGKIWLYIFYIFASLSWGVVGSFIDVPRGYHLSLAIVTLALFGQVYKVDLYSSISCLQAFKENQYIGFLLFFPSLMACIVEIF